MKMPTSKGLSLVGDDQLTKTGVGENDTIRVNGGGGGGSSGGGSGSSGGGSNGGGGGGNGGNVVNNGGGGSVPETNGNTDRSMSYASSMIQMMDPIYNMSRIGYNQTDHGQPPVGPDGTTLVVSHHQMMDSHPSYNGSHQERGRHAITPDNIHPSLSHQLMESHHGYENVSRDRSRHSITPENLQTHQYLASARATYDPPAEQVHSDSQQLLSGRSNYDTVPDRRSALTPDSHTQKTRDTAKSLLLNNSKQQYSQHSSVGLVDPQMIKYEIPDLTGKGPPMGNENLLYKDVFVNSYDKVINRCLENPVIHQNGLVDVSAPHKIYPYARDSLMSQEGAPGKMMVPSSGMLAPSSTESLMGRQGSSAGMGDITGKVNSLQDDLQIRMDTRSKMEIPVNTRPVMSSKNGSKAPLCKVCGDESSGFHYGVDSCEGCKGFFRRCITQGMSHKCANEEKCEITPFTRNSCQYCRLKKCFAVGMSREASRLGRRPKRLKEAGGESKSHTTNVPIAPYPSPLGSNRRSMADLQKLIQSNGTFKSDLMQAFLAAAQASFKEHAHNSNSHKQTESAAAAAAAATTATATTTTTTPNTSNSIPNGVESGYSSLNSPASSSSQSPVHLQPHPNTNNTNNSTPNSTTNGSTTAPSNTNSNNTANVPPPPVATSSSNTIQVNGIRMKTEPVENNITNGVQPNAIMDGTGASNMMTPNGISNGIIANGIANSGIVSSAADIIPANMLNTTANGLANGIHEGCTERISTGTSSNKDTSPSSFVMPETPNSTSSAAPTPQTPSHFDESQSLIKAEPKFSPCQNMPKFLVDKFIEEGRQEPSEPRKKLIEQVTVTIVDAHMVTCRVTHDAVLEAYQRWEENKTRITASLQTQESASEHMWGQFLSNMVPEITNVVKFCKRLPGFSEIDQEDQIKLIKQGTFEVMLARFCMLVNHDNYTMFDPDMKMQCPREIIRAMPLGKFLEEFFSMAETFNPLKLTDGEIGLFTSVLIICPDRQNLSGVKAISKIQGLFLQALYNEIKHTHEDYDTLFESLIRTIPMFREFNHQHSMTLNSIRMESTKSRFDFPDLHKEVFDFRM